MSWSKPLIEGGILAVVALVVQFGVAMATTAIIGQSLWNLIPFGAEGTFIAVVALGNYVKEAVLKV